ncbi:MAG: hypothetical protein K9N55_02660 [Phycisphaerae bacterium]|nr:hypothetical protein [Phycisphaerae bacterium]
MIKKQKKIGIAASAGGHLSELLMLTRAWQDVEDCFYVSSSDVVKDRLSDYGKTYIVGECNREHPILTIRAAYKCWRVAWREKPDIVISSGAAPGFLFCLFSKLLGAKIIWVDSIANTERLSLSGRMIYCFSDLILSQWENVAEKYTKVQYCGEVL